MTWIDRHTMGELYGLHFGRPIGNPTKAKGQAQHYWGWSLDAAARTADHLAGRSDVAIVRAALAAGITLTPFVLGAAPKHAEWYLKRKVKNLVCFCPACAAVRGRQPRAIPPAAFQLPLPLVDQADDDFEFCDVPAPALPRIDWYEISRERAWRAARPAPAPMPAIDVDDWL